MRIIEEVRSPNTFIVKPYQPGLHIDFTEQAKNTDLDQVRRDLCSQLATAKTDDLALSIVEDLLVPLGVSDRRGDFAASLLEYTGATDIANALDQALSRFGLLRSINGAVSFVEKVEMILQETGVLHKAENFPTRLYCHIPNELTKLPGDGTHFGFVMSGNDNYVELSDGYRYHLRDQSYFCIPGESTVEGSGQIEIVTRIGYSGLLQVGGQIEPWGRLKYIDGCSDTLLVPPIRRGDPCLNALYFPPATSQTSHAHPSIRAGLVIGGEGVCKTPTGNHSLLPGYIFFLPPETWHSFHTGIGQDMERAALKVVAYHPDSDTGPTDEDHPMLNRTYFMFTHRLASLARKKEL